MSFNIGPYVGKKSAVLAKLDQPNEWYDKDPLYQAAKAFLVAQVVQLPDEKPVMVQSFGHRGEGSSQTSITVSVNTIVQGHLSPLLVE